MELIIGYNTYITSEECDKILSDYYGPNSEIVAIYEGLDEDAKEAYLYRSFLDMQRLLYRGFKKEKNQKASFPRVNRFGKESDEGMVKLAQALNSTVFVLEDNSDTNDTSIKNVLGYGRYGLKTYKLGSFSVSVDGSKYSTAIAHTSKSGLVEEVLSEWLKGGCPIV